MEDVEEQLRQVLTCGGIRAINAYFLPVIESPAGIIIKEETEATDIKTRRLLSKHGEGTLQEESPGLNDHEKDGPQWWEYDASTHTHTHTVLVY